MTVANTFDEARKMLKEIALDVPASQWNNLVGINAGRGYGTRIIFWVAPRVGTKFLGELEAANCPLPVVALVEQNNERKILIGMADQ